MMEDWVANYSWSFTREARIREYDATIVEIRDVGKLYSMLILTIAAGNGVLLTIFQSFSNSANVDVKKNAIFVLPSIIVTKIVPFLGMTITTMFIFGIAFWLYSFVKVRVYGLYLEKNLKLSNKCRVNGYFSKVVPSWFVVGLQFGFALLIFTVSFTVWDNIDVEFEQNSTTLYEGIITQKTKTFSMPGVKYKTPEFTKTKRGKKGE